MTEPRGHIGVCSDHGKRLFSSRKQARQEIRRSHIGAAMREYRCTSVAGHWHIGQLPPAVMEGRLTARQVYGRWR
ncbi:hypothetical protein ACH5AJ_36625 [Streptomyces rochei]|uniref:hypothetical protein n=1 Tax=Streptomyces rochei TaxID=1928 RepID=UPI00378F837D